MTLQKSAQRKPVKFTSSRQSDVDFHSYCCTSDSQTPPSIPARKASIPVKKGTMLEKGIDLRNVIQTPARGSTNSKLAMSGDEDPNPKQQRVTRHQGHNRLNYDTRLHPLDKYTRPSHFAKVSAEYGGPTQGSEYGETSDGDMNDNEKESDESSPGPREADSRADEEDAADNEKRPLKTSSRIAKRTSTPRLPSPNRRRSARSLGRSAAPNYDMKLHPDYDRVHRPATIKAALRRKSDEHESRRGSSETDTASFLAGDDNRAQGFTVNGETGLHLDATPMDLSFSAIQAIAIPQLPKGVKGRSPAPANGKKHPKLPPRAGSAPPAKEEDPSQSLPSMRKAYPESSSSKEYSSTVYGRVTALDFNELSSFDSRLYRLQNGAPTHGYTLPKTWEYVKQLLFENGEISLDTFNSPDSTERIKARYEAIRLGVEAFWTSNPDPTDDRDWTLRYMESFRVFDQERGSKYWRHYEDSLYRPLSTRWRDLGQLAETDDYEEFYNTLDDRDGSAQYGTNDKGTAPWIVGADEVASVSSSPLHASTGEGIHKFKDRTMGRPYVGLGDGDEEQTDADPDRTLVESMRDSVYYSDPVISNQELTDLLSHVAEHVFEPRGTGKVMGSTTGIILSDPASSVVTEMHSGRANTSVASPEANVIKGSRPPKSTPRLLEALTYGRQTSVTATNDVASSQYNDNPQTYTVPSRGKKRKLRNEQEVIIHEDSPNREEAMAQNSESPRTDLPKENVGRGEEEEEEEAAEYSNVFLMRTPTTQRDRQAVSTPSIARVAPGGIAKRTPTHLSFFNGLIGTVSPLA